MSLISWIDEKVSDATAHRYFWDIWFSTARMMAAWSSVCALVYMMGIERPSQPVDYLIATVFGLVYAVLSGAVVGFLPALAAAANVDEGEAAMIKASGAVFLLQWALLGVIFYFVSR